MLRRLSKCARNPICTSCFRNTAFESEFLTLQTNPATKDVIYKNKTDKTDKTCQVNLWPDSYEKVHRQTEQNCRQLSNHNFCLVQKILPYNIVVRVECDVTSISGMRPGTETALSNSHFVAQNEDTYRVSEHNVLPLSDFVK